MIIKYNKYVISKLAILVLALLIRLIHINSSFWLDEAAQALESARPLNQQLNILADFQPPLYHLLVHFWMVGGRSEWWLRLTSLIPGLITIWFGMKFSEKLFGRHHALIGGMLMATSQFHTFYSQELRPYSLAAMWGILTTYCLFIDDNRKARIFFIIFSIAGCYTTYLFPLLTLAQILVYKQFRKVIIWVLVFYIPWLPMFIKQFEAGTNLMAVSTNWIGVVSPPLIKMLPLVFGKFIIGRVDINVTLLDVIFGIFLFWLVVTVVIHALTKKFTKELLWLSIFPIVLAFIISIKVPVLDPKRVLFCLPIFYVILGAGISKSYKSLMVLIIFLFINISSLQRYAFNEQEQREPWREVVWHLSQVVKNDEVVIFVFLDKLAPWQWYENNHINTLAVSSTNIPLLNEYRKIYYFDYLNDIVDPQRIIKNSLDIKLNYYESGFFQYPLIGKVRVYEKI